jgi:hypothetical protein
MGLPAGAGDSIHGCGVLERGRVVMERYLGPVLLGAIERYVNQGILPGSFLEAVLCNDLKQACACADTDNRRQLFEIVQYLYWEVPSLCWGSPERVAAWLGKFEKAEAQS